MSLYVPPDADEAHAAWGANCGPAALAALVGVPVMDVRSWFPEFPGKAWANPTTMKRALALAGWTCSHADPSVNTFPTCGLAFIQWKGPWTEPGAAVAWAYRNTHWVASVGGLIYDVNATGWLTPEAWERSIVPLLLENKPKATGWTVRLGLDAAPQADGWLRPNPCGCGWCNVCGFYGEAPRANTTAPPLDPDAEKRPELDSPRRVKRPQPTTPSLFGEAPE